MTAITFLLFSTAYRGRSTRSAVIAPSRSEAIRQACAAGAEAEIPALIMHVMSAELILTPDNFPNLITIKDLLQSIQMLQAGPPHVDLQEVELADEIAEDDLRRRGKA